MANRILRTAVTVLCLLLCACAQQRDDRASTPTTVPSTPSPVPSQTLTPAPTNTATPTPTATPEPVYVNAVYWKTKLQAPVILYHRFLPLDAKESNATKMILSDFQAQIQALYDAGYSLVPLKDWLTGDIQVPTGRRPLIFTVDDAFFADQIFLEADGTPSERSGLGLLWHFSQEHPDFGFSGALFTNMGDKYYANTKTPTWFIVSDGWQDVLAKTIVWCIEHNMLPYNHTYMHSQLDIMEAPAIKDELKRNDVEIRNFLERAHRMDLVSRLDNYIALPYGVWPASQGLKDFMLAYRDPEGKPVEAVLEAGYYFQKLYLAAPFEAGFDRFHIPRITTNTKKSIEFLSGSKDLFPAAEECKLGPVVAGKELTKEDYLALISAAIQSGQCPAGTYRVGSYFFDAQPASARLVWTVSKGASAQK
jgi:hypothetical protein